MSHFRSSPVSQVGQQFVTKLGHSATTVKHAEEKKRSKANIKLKAKKIVSCYECKIAENSDAEQALAQDWIRCCRCPVWCHEQER